MESDTVSLQNSILSETTTVTSRTSISSLRRLSIDTSSSSLDTSSTFSFDQTAESEFQKETNQKAKAEDFLVGPSPIRRACRYNCFCRCHIQSIHSADTRLVKIHAHKHLCTDSNCIEATLSKEKSMNASTFFCRIMSHVMMSNSIKVRYHLNTYRMVSEGSNAMRYVKHGNLEKLKMCIESGEATLWDTAPDGWSLLHVSDLIN